MVLSPTALARIFSGFETDDEFGCASKLIILSLMQVERWFAAHVVIFFCNDINSFACVLEKNKKKHLLHIFVFMNLKLREVQEDNMSHGGKSKR